MMPHSRAPLSPNAKAVAWMLASVVAFTTLTVAVRQLAGAHDTFEIMAVRSAIGLVIVLIFAKLTNRLGEVKRDRVAGHIARNAMHFIGQNLWLWALVLIPMAQVIALEFTSPIWVMLLSPFLLGEKLSKLRVAAALVGFTGVLIVANPDFSHIELGVIAAFASSVFFAATNIATKRLTRHETIISIMFWLTLLQLIFGTVLAFADGQVIWPTATTLPWLFLIGVSGLLAHGCLTMALREAPASFVMPFDFLRLPMVALCGFLLFGEDLGLLLLAGAALIIIANLINIRASTAKTHKV